LEMHETGNNFLNRVPIAQNISKNWHRGLHQVKRFLHSKENNRVNRLPIGWKKIFASSGD
jgi:hypothetical protein